MTQVDPDSLRVSKVVPGRKERVFSAWTDPAKLKKWWTIGEGWTTSFAEVDLKVGGRFSLGNEQAGGAKLVITGEFLVVEPNDRLVYTWRFPGEPPQQSVVTVEFKGMGDATEVVVTHEQAMKIMGPEAVAGWNAILRSLALWSSRAGPSDD
ncbi:MAG: SRPBCC family protein [Nitrososphaerales archaeon]|jgi:uncharacterized protein YndB with AHSA1/START domain